MANIHAIQTTCDAVVRLLEGSYRSDLIEPQLNLQFDVYGTEDFKNHMASGVTLFLYRVYISQNQRAPVIRASDGKAVRPSLPLDLHFFLTVWAPKASLQHAILGWAMRMLEDRPVLPASLLNGVRRNVFREDETVEVVAGQLTNEELMRIWDDLPAEYHLSVPYIARIVRIESSLEVSPDSLVKQRQLEYGAVSSWT
jgi:hypothetical protein